MTIELNSNGSKHETIAGDRHYAVAFVCGRLPGMSFEEYIDHYETVHFPLAIRLPGLVKYIQLPFRPSGTLSKEVAAFAGYDSLSIYVFESEEAYHRSQEGPERVELEKDSVQLMDLPRNLEFPVWSGLEFISSRYHPNGVQWSAANGHKTNGNGLAK